MNLEGDEIFSSDEEDYTDYDKIDSEESKDVAET